MQSEKKTAEAALKLQMEKVQLKRLEEKKQRDAERKQEEELRKKAEAVLGACWGTEELGWNERSRK